MGSDAVMQEDYVLVIVVFTDFFSDVFSPLKIMDALKQYKLM